MGYLRSNARQSNLDERRGALADRGGDRRDLVSLMLAGSSHGSEYGRVLEKVFVSG